MRLELARELGRGQPIDLDALQGIDETNALHGGTQGLARPHGVALGNQVLDDLGPGGRGADALLVQDLGEVLVLDLPTGVLHQREQARLGDARGRPGGLCLGLHLAGGDGNAGDLGLVRRQRRQGLGLLVALRRGQRRAPAGHLKRAGPRPEALALELGDSLHALPDGGRMEGGEEAPHHEIEQALVVSREARTRDHARRDDGEVVGDPGSADTGNRSGDR
jgi:hypothetical protein